MYNFGALIAFPAVCQFDNIFLGNLSNGSIQSFWHHVREQRPWQDHAGLASLSEDELQRAIPFCAHGDGAELYRDNEFFVWSWTSAFSTGSMFKDVLLNRFPIVVISEFQMQLEDVARQQILSRPLEL